MAKRLIEVTIPAMMRFGGISANGSIPSGHADVPGMNILGKKLPQNRTGAKPAITTDKRLPRSAYWPHNKYREMIFSTVIEYH